MASGGGVGNASILFYLSRSLRDRFYGHCQASGLSMSFVLRNFVQVFCDRYEQLEAEAGASGRMQPASVIGIQALARSVMGGSFRGAEVSDGGDQLELPLNLGGSGDSGKLEVSE